MSATTANGRTTAPAVAEDDENYAPIGTSGRVVLIECPDHYRRIVVPNIEASGVICVNPGTYAEVRRESGAQEVNRNHDEGMEQDDDEDDDANGGCDAVPASTASGSGETKETRPKTLSAPLLFGEGATGKVDKKEGIDEEAKAETWCTDRFITEEVMHNDTPCVAFRTCGTSCRYLTCVLYGDQHRQDMAMAVASSLLPKYVPVELIPSILDFVVPAHEKSFEGEGFNYFPITSEEVSEESGRRPNALQLFRLRCRRDGHGNLIPSWTVGIETLVGRTYLRCQWWKNAVSQSSHCRGDEQWIIRDRDRNDEDSEYDDADELLMDDEEYHT